MAENDSPTSVDDKALRRILIACNNLLSNALLTNGSKDNIYNLAVEKNGSNILEKEEISTVLQRQSQLFSDSIVPDQSSSYNIFADNTTNRPMDTEYTIHNCIILYIDQKAYYFNIDEVNKNNKQIFFSKLNIKNKSKDAFTLKGNYHITLTINFTSFDDLLARGILVRAIDNPKDTITIPLMKILYKYFEENYGSEADRHLPDAEGIFLNQILKFYPDTNKFDYLEKILSNDEISKTYHLTYYKHNFEMFKSQEPIFKYFENELVIEYIAYEADGVDKPINPDLASTLIPKVNANLFTLLDTQNFRDLLGKAPFLSDSIKNFSTLIEQAKNYDSDLAEAVQALECEKSKKNQQGEKQQQQRIDKKIEEIKKIKTLASRALIFTILNSVQVYKLKVPYNLLGIYMASSSWESFKDNLPNTLGNMFGVAASSAIQGAAMATISGLAAGTGVTAAAVGAGALAAWPFALLAVGGIAAYAIISAINSKKVQSRIFDLSEIQKQVGEIIKDGLKAGGPNSKYNFTIEPKNRMILLAKGGEGEAGEAANIKIDKSSTFSKLDEKSENATNKIKEILSSMNRLEILEEELAKNSMAPIYFTTFGEIMKLLITVSPNQNLTILSGGYFYETDITKEEAAYIPFSTIPITINSFAQFLFQKLEETDRGFNYDSELFFRDVYEDLIKSVLLEGQAELKSLKNTVPKNLKVVSTIHLDGGEFGINFSDWLKDTNLLDEEGFKELKLNFIKSKNLNLLRNEGIGQGSIRKIYTIGSYEEIKYFDYYENYRQWAIKNNKKQYIFNSLSFQEYICKEHFMPCLLVRNIANSESILRKKSVNFSRIDNVNLNTGNYLNSFGQLRYPYEFKGQFKPFLAFFLDIGSYMFVAPPGSNTEAQINMFGFGGLYIVRGSELEYVFQRIQNEKITIPNLESNYNIDGYMLTHGDKIFIQEINNDQKDPCVKQASNSPARNSFQNTYPEIDRYLKQRERERNPTISGYEAGLVAREEE